MDIKKRKRGTLIIFDTLFVILLSIVIIISLNVDREYSQYEGTKTNILDMSISAADIVEHSVIDYLCVVDEATWSTAKFRTQMTDDLKSMIYTDGFYTFECTGVTEYLVTSKQYEISDTDTVRVLINVLVTVKGETKSLSFIGTVKDLIITDLKVY